MLFYFAKDTLFCQRSKIISSARLILKKDTDSNKFRFNKLVGSFIEKGKSLRQQRFGNAEQCPLGT